METVHTSSRKKKNTTRTSIVIAIVVHLLMALVGAFWAAHEGYFGNKLRDLAVFMVPKNKVSDEPQKAKPQETKKDEELQKVQQVVKTMPVPPKYNPPAGSGGAVAPPPAFSLPPISFGTDEGDGTAAGDVISAYKQQVETTLRTRWDRPSDVQDLSFVAEVELNVDAQGKIASYNWLRGSGNGPWDNSVKKVLAECKAISRPPPKGFPDKFKVRFDVQSSTEQLISRAD